MSAPTLLVPKPALRFDDAGGGAAALEKPVTVVMGAVTDGTSPLAPDGLATFGLFVYRRSASGAGREIWDDAAKVWKPDPGSALDALRPTALAHLPADPAPWQAVVVGAGGRDQAGAPQYAKAHGGYPTYGFQAWFVTKDGAARALGPPSDNLTFAGASDRDLMVVGPGEDEKPPEATQTRVLLKNSSLQTIGQLTMDRASPGATITLANGAGASVVLHPDGLIEITPAAGARVLVSGDLETERITFRPGAGGAKQTL